VYHPYLAHEQMICSKAVDLTTRLEGQDYILPL